MVDTKDFINLERSLSNPFGRFSDASAIDDFSAQNVVSIDKKLLIDLQHLSIGHVISEGPYSVVYEGLWVPFSFSWIISHFLKPPLPFSWFMFLEFIAFLFKNWILDFSWFLGVVGLSICSVEWRSFFLLGTKLLHCLLSFFHFPFLDLCFLN